MQEIEFTVPQHCDLRQAEKLIEQVCSGLGLQVAMKASLASYPGSIHWHYKRDRKQSGTLELTLLVPGRRVWAQVQNRRKASWIDDVLPEVRRAIETALLRTKPRPS